MIFRKFYIVLALISGSILAQGQSVLSTGTWHKIGVTESGVYKIDAAFLSNELNINTSNLDPRSVKIYGHGGGGMLPQGNDVFRYNDPPENAIYASGESDGSFDEGDYFIFYGNSPNKIKLHPNGSLDYSKNLYSDTTYYLLTYGGEPGLRLESLSNPSSSGASVDYFHDFIIYEEDDHNILNSGREWYSFPYTTAFGYKTSESFEYNRPGVRDSIGIDIKLLGASLFSASFDLNFNDNFLDKVPVAPLSSGTYTYRAFEYPQHYSLENNTSEDLKLDIKFNENRVNGQTSQGHLDYFILGFERDLDIYDGQTIFRNRKVLNQTNTYSIRSDGQAGISIWNISDKLSPKIQAFTQSGNTISFNEINNGSISEYIVFSIESLSAPFASGQVSNQDIKASINVDGIIISAPEFMSEAQRLASFHQDHDGLNIAIVTPKQIYNEFSSGMQDISAIRDYLKYTWETGGQLKYVLLFGDCSYDYKRNNATHVNKSYSSLPDHNFVPVYESFESNHRLYSHSSDDFYGFFESSEGDWYEGDKTITGRPKVGTYNDHTLEIGVGRIPAKTIEEANVAVDKIIRYATSENTLGDWRTKIAYVADDGDDNIHMEDVEDLNKILQENFPQYDASKIYLDNFDQPDYKSPRMRRALQEKIADGVFIIDYLGHGGSGELMQEEVIDKKLILELNNRHKLPLFVTATCNFGVYDDPSQTSGAEEFLFHPNGGAIALLTTTRAVFAQTNFKINSAFHESVFMRDESGEHLRLGDVMRLTKNNGLNGPVNRNFALLGDPMLRLNYPEYEIRFEELESQMDTLSALEEVNLEGSIIENGSLLQTFQGRATVTVWDIPRQKITKGLDNPEFQGLEFEANDPFTYTEQDNALFRGDVSVTDGEFEVSFVLPKNSSYKYERGRVAVYALNENDFVDATGASRNFLIGGSADLLDDQISPLIVDTYINEPSFKNGDVVGPSSLFVAKVSDENGINISSNGFNQSLTLTLNDTLTLDLNDFYTADLNSFQSGTIVYPLENFPEGTYTGELKIWDTYNNNSTTPVEFKVSDKPKIRLFNVMNYPNPVSLSGETTFTFEHDRVGEQLIIKIAVFDMMGKKVNQWVYDLDDVSNRIDNLTRHTTNDRGDRLKKGVYFYKLQVTSTADGATNEVINRLLINY
ncbi:MAG: type IX secretion system sortase PorU [Cyclobacteriaceae bacterium]